MSDLLSESNCVDSTRIRAFLRLSRIATDDTIKTHLNEINRSQCDSYFQTHIVPQWNARSKLIQYCKDYSHRLRSDIHETELGPAKEFDLRLDPYALKEYEQAKQQKFSQIETIDNWVENEQMVESIVRQQTHNTFNDKCYFKDWLGYFDQLSTMDKATIDKATVDKSTMGKGLWK